MVHYTSFESHKCGVWPNEELQCLWWLFCLGCSVPYYSCCYEILLDATPSDYVLPSAELLWMESDDHRKQVLKRISLNIADTLNLNFNNFIRQVSTDEVNAYANQLLSLGCFYLEYSDAIREGDGLRVLHCWRYLLPMFLNSGKKNYAIESLNLLLQHDHILSPRQAAELIWSRFINVHGLPGRNIPNDLHIALESCA